MVLTMSKQEQDVSFNEWKDENGKSINRGVNACEHLIQPRRSPVVARRHASFAPLVPSSKSAQGHSSCLAATAVGEPRDAHGCTALPGSSSDSP